MRNLAILDQARLLSGAERAAAVLLAIDRDVSQRILKYFSEEELRAIARIAARLGSIPGGALENICNDLVDEIGHADVSVVGSASEAESLLSGVLPEEQLAEIMCELHGSSNRFFWRRISELPEASVAEYLAGEHPQLIAIVLTKVEPAFAARVLAQLGGDLRAVVMRRILVAKPVKDEVIRVIEAGISEQLFSTQSTISPKEVNAKVAGIINQLERDQIDEILQGISAAEPIIAAQLKTMLFSFEDIVRLDQRARSIVFDQVATDIVILALRGSESDIRDAILPCLSNRTRRMVEAELASDASPPRREVLGAQRQISNAVLRLADQGLIELPTSGENAAPSP